MELSKSDQIIQSRIKCVLPHLNELQRRIYLGAEAASIGWGGKSKISSLSGVCRASISSGIEAVNQQVSSTRLRKTGGGRKKSSDNQPSILHDIREIIEPHTMGDPENPLIWSSKSTRKVRNALQDKGYTISHETVRKSMKVLGYSLQSNKKTKEGGDHPDRDAQFEHINALAKDFLSAGDPVISVVAEHCRSIDCKKKELIGEYKNNGQEWTPAGSPTEVNVYDFVDKTNGKAAPYGIYNIGNNRGWVSVGISSDTGEFAVSTIRSWWEEEGKNLYPNTKRLYINISTSSITALMEEAVMPHVTDFGKKNCSGFQMIQI